MLACTHTFVEFRKANSPDACVFFGIWEEANGSNIDCYNHIKIIVYFKDKLSTKVQHNADSTKTSTADITAIILLFSI